MHRLPVRLEDDVHLARPRGAARSERSGIRVHRLAVPPAERVLLAGVAATSGPRTWLDLAAHLGLEDLVAVGDAVARSTRRRGARRTPPTRDRAGAAGRHPYRCACRLTGRDAPPPAAARRRVYRAPARRGGPRRAWRLACQPGLADEVARVALQHDGEVHFLGGVERWRQDQLRDELTREQGWEVIQTTALDGRRPGQLIDRVARAYLRSAAVRGAQVLPMHLR